MPRRASTRFATLLVTITTSPGCGGGDSSSPQPDASIDPFGNVAPLDQAALDQYADWEDILPNSATFVGTEGHAGQIVRVHFNETAAPTYGGTAELPFPPGSIIAKAVVSSTGAASDSASRVYFMKKMSVGSVPSSADWIWAVATRSDGSLSYTSGPGEISFCTRCHQQDAQWDYARTVDYHRQGRAP